MYIYFIDRGTYMRSIDIFKYNKLLTSVVKYPSYVLFSDLDDLEWPICRGLIPLVHPQVLPCVCSCGIIPVRPRVTSFITARTTFKASGDILSRPFALLSDLHLPDSLKSSLICETMANWHPDDWWDSPHPHIYIFRLVHLVPDLQQDWKDDKLYHDASFDTIPSRLADVMIALSLLRNHHYKGLLNTIEPSSTFEHYKNSTEIEHGQDTGSSLILSLSLSLS